jgi:hypothetical protein
MREDWRLVGIDGISLGIAVLRHWHGEELAGAGGSPAVHGFRTSRCV